MASFPDDLTKESAYNTMKTCILGCDGVSVAASQTAPAHASSATTTTTTSTSDAYASTTANASASNTTSNSASDRNVVLAGVAAAGFGALAFLL